jgi:hypothetical protein
VAGQEFGRHTAFIANRDGVGKNVAFLIRVRLFCNVLVCTSTSKL